MRFFTGAIAVVAFFAALVAPAQAQTYIYNGTFAGTVTSGTDTSGYFTGTAGSALDGQAITGTFRYDAAFAAPSGPGTYTGDASGQFLAFTITVAGTQYAFGGFPGDLLDYGQITVTNAPDSVDYLALRGALSGANELLTFSIMPSSALTGTGLQGFSGGTGSGLFQLDSGNALADASFNIASASATLQVTPPTSAVPEPATWLQMIVGIGLAGAALRRWRLPVAVQGFGARVRV